MWQFLHIWRLYFFGMRVLAAMAILRACFMYALDIWGLL